MKKITIKKLIEFRGKSHGTRLTLINNLNKEVEKSNDDSGGDYWISCLSAIRNTFKTENISLLEEKIELLELKIKSNSIKKNQVQFQRNIDILNRFKDLNIKNYKPDADLSFLKQPKINSILTINGLPIEARPCLIYSFSINGNEEIGGVWFVAQLNGFKKAELGMFSDIMYRYLDKHFSNNYYINPNFCYTIDLFNGQEVNYREIENGTIPILIDSTIEDLKKV